MHPSLVFFFFCPSFSVHTYNTYKRRNAVIDCPALLGWLNEMLYNYSFCFFLREKKANSETLWLVIRIAILGNAQPKTKEQAEIKKGQLHNFLQRSFLPI